MRAHLVLKNEAGAKSVYPTAATVGDLEASPEVVKEAETAAEGLGFKVVETTPLRVTIEGSKTKFEKIFGSRVKSVAPSTAVKGRRGAKAPRAETTAPGQGLAWDGTPKLPEALRNAVASVLLPALASLHLD